MNTNKYFLWLLEFIIIQSKRSTGPVFSDECYSVSLEFIRLLSFSPKCWKSVSNLFKLDLT